ncbi:UDP-N-acetylglucosamine transferase subunit alg13 [Sphaceloma murrayae]|uniref:UDP-N-acetylglucosamine transferase subunit ALG13 n=1 Tax=Sphaceloma murrayae TaxID=2082308 RepID=A0A2K1QVV5_9PEZI|nr:UDP-N-acetylglucosamine transferase subunit alg13 [Sphaceloma murrayae]
MSSWTSSQSSTTPRSRRTCFVTIGATASFDRLIRSVLTRDFIQALARHGYTELIVQFGAGGEDIFHACTSPPSSKEIVICGVEVRGFSVDTQGLDHYMKRAKGVHDQAVGEGCVISHAGTGTILSAMRLGVPVIVVPNEDLLDNHQVELAEILAKQGYVVHGQVNNLSEALDRSEALRKTAANRPPVNSGEHRKSGTIKQVLDEELGFLD